MSNEIAVTEPLASAPALLAPMATKLFASMDTMEKIVEFSRFMAEGATLPDHFKGKPADCMALTLQAIQWGMLPNSIAGQCFLVNGTLGFSAQLINAVISSSTAILGRFHYEYSDGWERLAGKCKNETKNGKKYAVKTWTDADEKDLWIKVGAVLRNETEICWGEEVYMASVLIRNSPLWITNPKQQMAYLGLKLWSRIHTPAVTMGVYTPEELREIAPERDVTPAPKVSVLEGPKEKAKDPAAAVDAVAEVIEEKEPAPDLVPVDDITKALKACTNIDDLNKASQPGLLYKNDSDEHAEIKACFITEKARILRAIDAARLKLEEEYSK